MVCCSCASKLAARGLFSSFVFPVVFQFLEAMNLCSPSKKIYHRRFLLCVALSVLGLPRLGYLAGVNEECALMVGKQKNFGHVSYNVLDNVKEHSTIRND